MLEIFFTRPIYVTRPSCLAYFEHVQTSSDASRLCKYFQPANIRFSLKGTHGLPIRGSLRNLHVLGNLSLQIVTQFFRPTLTVEFLFFVYPLSLVIFSTLSSIRCQCLKIVTSSHK